MSAQLDRILADLERHKHAFDFDRDHFAHTVAEAAAAAIFEAMEAEVGPDGARWPELSETYAARKARIAPGAKMSELHYRMKQPDQLKGELDVSPHELRQTYGLDDGARQEAVWFQEGNDRQPARPFYDFNAGALRNLAGAFDDRFHAETR